LSAILDEKLQNFSRPFWEAVLELLPSFEPKFVHIMCQENRCEIVVAVTSAII